MTDKTENSQSGEQRLKSRQNALITFTILGFVLAMGVGFATGFIGALYEDGTAAGWMVVGLWALAVVGFTWFTISYFRRIDELDLMDNIWATMIAFYFYVVAMPSWMMFHDIGMVGEPSGVVIYAATMAVLVIAYFARKLGLR